MPDDRSRLLATSEQLTLWTLGATISFYVVGEISSSYRLQALGIRGLRIEVQWQQRVFEGGIAILNSLLNLSNGNRIGWPAIALVCTGLLVVRPRLGARPRLHRAVTGLAICAYLATLVVLAISWGRFQADYVRKVVGGTDHFVFAKDAQLPAELARLNDARKLKLVATTPEFLVALGPGEGDVFRIATGDVRVVESSP